MAETHIKPNSGYVALEAVWRFKGPLLVLDGAGTEAAWPSRDFRVAIVGAQRVHLSD